MSRPLEGLPEFEQYPGSTQRVVDWAKSPAIPRVLDVDELLLVVAKPQFLLPWPKANSEPVQFYTTGDLGYALGRSAQTIRNWEVKDAILPEAPCVTTNWSKHAKRRLYQHDLVVEIYNIAVDEGICGAENKHKSIHATKFTIRVRSIWGKYT